MSCTVRIQGTLIDLDKPKEVYEYVLAHHDESTLQQLSSVLSSHINTAAKFDWWCVKYEWFRATAHVGRFIEHLF